MAENLLSDYVLFLPIADFVIILYWSELTLQMGPIISSACKS